MHPCHTSDKKTVDEVSDHLTTFCYAARHNCARCRSEHKLEEELIDPGLLKCTEPSSVSNHTVPFTEGERITDRPVYETADNCNRA